MNGFGWQMALKHLILARVTLWFPDPVAVHQFREDNMFPGYNDYGKSLVLRIIVRDGNNIVYQNDFSAGTVAAKDISDDIPVPDFSYTDTTYTGEGTRVTPANYEDATFAGIKDANGNPFKASDFKINYRQMEITLRMLLVRISKLPIL